MDAWFAGSVAAHQRSSSPSLPWEEGVIAMIFGGPTPWEVRPERMGSISAWMNRDGGDHEPPARGLRAAAALGAPFVVGGEGLAPLTEGDHLRKGGGA